jgi:hypothetical protein
MDVRTPANLVPAYASIAGKVYSRMTVLYDQCVIVGGAWIRGAAASRIPRRSFVRGG